MLQAFCATYRPNVYNICRHYSNCSCQTVRKCKFKYKGVTMKAFLTKDFYLAAFLVSKDIRMLDYVKEDELTLFRFPDTDKLQQLVRDFYAGNSVVETMKYGMSLKALKSIIHNTNTNTNGNKSITTTGSYR